MALKEFRDDVAEEIEIILGKEFSIEVSKTNEVPHADTAGITFPNLDEKYQSCKIITTSVLYIDIRRSTQLSLEHKPETVAKLYSAFVRAMTRCAQYYGGHVRGIIGDRVMVIFNPSTAFEDAVNTAVLMNSVCKHHLNKYFTSNEITCGIGLDYGRMLATKTGIRRNGANRANYRSLVWLGRPANVASKLTDIANKPRNFTVDTVQEGHFYKSLNKWGWYQVDMDDFVKKLKPTYMGPTLRHPDEYFVSFFPSSRSYTLTAPPILMTKPVYDGFKNACPEDNTIKNDLWKVVKVPATAYSGTVYGGDIIFPAVKADV